MSSFSGKDSSGDPAAAQVHELNPDPEADAEAWLHAEYERGYAEGREAAEKRPACSHCDGTGEVLEPSRTPEEPSRMIPCGNCQPSSAAQTSEPVIRQPYTRPDYNGQWFDRHFSDLRVDPAGDDPRDDMTAAYSHADRERDTMTPAKQARTQEQRALLRLLDEALDLVREVYGYAVHEPNTRRVNEAVGCIRAKAVRYGGTRPLG